jgi:hypothetical protein
MSDDFREEAEKHWGYTKGLFDRVHLEDLVMEDIPDLLHYLYVEAMVHGFGHGKEYAEKQK